MTTPRTAMTFHERTMRLTEASVALRRRLTPHPSECPVNESGEHETYGGLCHCGWSRNHPVAGSAVAPDRQELTVMLVAIEEAAVAAYRSQLVSAVGELPRWACGPEGEDQDAAGWLLDRAAVLRLLAALTEPESVPA